MYRYIWFNISCASKYRFISVTVFVPAILAFIASFVVKILCQQILRHLCCHDGDKKDSAICDTNSCTGTHPLISVNIDLDIDFASDSNYCVIMLTYLVPEYTVSCVLTLLCNFQQET